MSPWLATECGMPSLQEGCSMQHLSTCGHELLWRWPCQSTCMSYSIASEHYVNVLLQSPNIKWPMLPREPIYVWNHLSLRTIRFRSQPTVWDWILVRAIQYKGWSTVSGIILLSFIWCKLHSSVDARWIAGIKANRWEEHNIWLSGVLLMVYYLPEHADLGVVWMFSTEWRSIKTTDV